MNQMYQVAGISKQALWKYNRQLQEKIIIKKMVTDHIEKVRKKHKRMGCRSIYYCEVQKNFPVGRDLFEQIGFENGYRLKRKRNKQKTTWSQRVEVFPNLIEGMELNGMNQIWQSDIFYLKVEDQDFYGVTIEDVYSRTLLSLHISQSLQAGENLKALKQAIKYRKGKNLTSCIFHSDRGSQYISEAHKQLLKSTGMKISMGKLPQENAYVERLQGTVKNDYFYENKITPGNIKKMARLIQKLYNSEKPHRSLNMLTPAGFEKLIQRMSDSDRPVTKIYQGFAEIHKSESFQQRKK